MTGGAYLSAGSGEGRRRPEVGTLSHDGGENQAGAPPARVPAGPTERSGGPGKSGPTRMVQAG
jgi:hypothetical protein